MDLAIRSRLGKLDIITPTTPFPTAPKNSLFSEKKRGGGVNSSVAQLTISSGQSRLPSYLNFQAHTEGLFYKLQRFSSALYLFYIYIFSPKNITHRYLWPEFPGEMSGKEI